MSLWDWLQDGGPESPFGLWPGGVANSYYHKIVYIKPVFSVKVAVYTSVFKQVLGYIYFLVPESLSTEWPAQPVCDRALQFFHCVGKDYPEVVGRMEAPLLQGFPEVFSEIVRSGVEGKSALERVLDGGPV